MAWNPESQTVLDSRGELQGWGRLAVTDNPPIGTAAEKSRAQIDYERFTEAHLYKTNSH